jgi:hypothetical protein
MIVTSDAERSTWLAWPWGRVLALFELRRVNFTGQQGPLGASAQALLRVILSANLLGFLRPCGSIVAASY